MSTGIFCVTPSPEGIRSTAVTSMWSPGRTSNLVLHTWSRVAVRNSFSETTETSMPFTNRSAKPLESTWLRGVETAKLAAFAALMSPETTSSRSTESPVERWIWPFTWSVAGPTTRSVEPSAETREMFSRKGERPGRRQLVAAGVDVIALPVGDGAVRIKVQIAPDQEETDHRAGFDRGAGSRACLATLLRSAAGEDPARHGFEAHGAEDRRITLDEFAREAPEPQRQL